MPVLTPGTSIPSFELLGVDGQSYQSSDVQKAKLSVFAFFKENCPTCQLAAPFLEKIAAHHRGDANILFWGVAQEDKPKAQEFNQRYGIKFPVLLDQAPYKVSSSYDLTTVPTVFVVDDQGKIVQTTEGFVKKEYEELAKRLGQASGKSKLDVFAGASVPELKPG